MLHWHTPIAMCYHRCQHYRSTHQYETQFYCPAHQTTQLISQHQLHPNQSLYLTRTTNCIIRICQCTTPYCLRENPNHWQGCQFQSSRFQCHITIAQTHSTQNIDDPYNQNTSTHQDVHTHLQHRRLHCQTSIIRHHIHRMFLRL